MLAVLDTVPIESVIERTGVRLVGRGRYLRAEDHDSLVVDTEAGCFNWNSRGLHGDAVTWLRRVCNMSFAEARKALEGGVLAGASLAAGQPLPPRKVRQRAPAEPPRPLPLDAAFDPHLKMSAAGWDWWRGEGLTDDAIRSFLVGEMQHRLYGLCYTIPIFNMDGELANVKLRLAEPGKVREFGKYRPLERGRGTHLFNSVILQDGLRHLVVVAGEKKVMVLHGYGVPAVSATGGCGNWQDGWTAALKQVPHIYVAFDDNDEPGADARLARRLGAKLVQVPGKPDDFIRARGRAAFVRLLAEGRRL